MTEDAFDEREHGFEAKFKMEQELQFKAESRRNKRLGLWAAERMGMTSSEAEAYAKEVVRSDLEEPGDADVIRKVMGDLEKRGIKVAESLVRQTMETIYREVVKDLVNEFPTPLGSNHRRVGG